MRDSEDSFKTKLQILRLRGGQFKDGFRKETISKAGGDTVGKVGWIHMLHIYTSA
jgi:hypothetical protein